MYSLIIISSLLSFLNAFLPLIVNRVTNVIAKCMPKSAVRFEIIEIKQRLRTMSTKDELVNYIKLQRVLNKLEEDYKSEVRISKTYLLKIKLGIQYISQAVLTIVGLALFWTQRSTPVVLLNEDWLYPFGSILSWPTNIPGALGFPVWFLVSNTVAKIASQPFT